jgi:hypothetical protein
MAASLGQVPPLNRAEEAQPLETCHTVSQSNSIAGLGHLTLCLNHLGAAQNFVALPIWQLNAVDKNEFLGQLPQCIELERNFIWPSESRDTSNFLRHASQSHTYVM